MDEVGADEICRRYACGERDFREIDVDDARGGTFRGARLDGVDLGRSFVVADFTRASLRGARFVGANVKTCIFDGADLSGADFRDACIDGASFRGAMVRGSAARARTAIRLARANSPSSWQTRGAWEARGLRAPSERPAGERSERAPMMKPSSAHAGGRAYGGLAGGAPRFTPFQKCDANAIGSAARLRRKCTRREPASTWVGVHASVESRFSTIARES
jgi:hypothetical protein